MMQCLRFGIRGARRSGARRSGSKTLPRVAPLAIEEKALGIEEKDEMSGFVGDYRAQGMTDQHSGVRLDQFQR